MTPQEWDQYQARVTRYVHRHGWPALLRAWVTKTKAEATPNAPVLLAHHALSDEIRQAWNALYEDAA